MTQASARLPDLDCACASARRAARLITQLYGREIGGGIEPTQFALLSALGGRPGFGQGPLGRALGLDKTSLSRNLRLLQRNGWIEPAATSADRRQRGYRLTPAGTSRLDEARTGWARAQARLKDALGPGEWDHAMELFGRVAEAALNAADSLTPKSTTGRLP